MILNFGKGGVKKGDIGELLTAIPKIGKQKITNGFNSILGKITGNDYYTSNPYAELGSIFANLNPDLPVVEALTGYNVQDKTTGIITHTKGLFNDMQEFYNTASEEMQHAMDPVWEQMIDGSAKVSDVIKQDAKGNVVFINKQMEGATQIISKGFGKIKSIAGGLLSSVLNTIGSMLIMKLASLIITGLGKAFDYFMHYRENIIKAGKEAEQKIDEEMQKIEDRAKSVKDLAVGIDVDVEDKNVNQTLEEIGKRYSELKNGVNELNNENRSLSTDEYEEYLKISNELAKQNPQLVKGYDSQNNAILDLGGTVEDITNKLQRMYEVSQNISQTEIKTNLNTAFEGIQTQLEDYEIAVSQAEAKQESIASTIQNWTNPYATDEGFLGTSIAINSAEFDSLRQAFKDEGLMDYVTETADEVVIRFQGELADKFDELNSDQTFANSVREVLGSIDYSYNNPEGLEKWQDALVETNTELDTLDLKTKDALASAQNLATQLLNSSSTFSKLNTDLQNSVLSNVKSIDYSQFETGDDLLNYLHKNIIGPLDNLSEEAQEKLVKIFDIDSSSTTLETYVDKVKNGLQDIFGDDIDQWYDYFGFSDLEERLLNTRNNLITRLESEYGDNFTEEQKQKVLTGWNNQEVENAFDLIADGFKGGFEKLAEAINLKPDIIKEGKLSDILGDETYTDSASKFESNISSIETALTSLRDNGKLTSDEMRKLQDTFNGMTDFSLENITRLGINELSKWTDELKTQAEEIGMSKEGMKQLQLYIQNLAMAYDDLRVSSTDAIHSLNNVYSDGSGTFEDVRQSSVRGSEVLSGLKQNGKYTGTNRDNQILYYLTLNPDSATWTLQQWLSEWDNMDVQMDLILEKKQIESEISSLNADIAGKENTINLDVELNGFSSKENYEEAIKLNDELIEKLQKNQEYAQKAFDALDGDITNSSYANLKTALNDANTQLAEAMKKTEEWKLMLNGGIELAGLTDQLKTLESTNQRIQDSMQLAESRGGSANVNHYQALINNATSQLENIKMQNFYLAQQQSVIDDNKAKYDELQSTIDSNNSSMASLIHNIEDYNNQLLHYATNTATELNSAINNALSESQSNIGMTNATMDTLIGQFHELSAFTGMDLSSIFIKTAKGVKVNADALQKLVKIQKTVYSKSLFNSILQGQQAVLKATNKEIVGEKTLTKTIVQKAVITRKGDKAHLEGAGAKLRAMNKEIAGYNAIMDAIELSMSGYQKWQDAQQTENPGDKYKSLYEAMGPMEKDRDEGLVGTDEFKAFVSLFDYWGRDTADAYDDMHDRFERYFYETSEGVKAFANDLVAFGFGTNNNGFYDFDLSDIDEIARAFNMSQEAIEIMFGRLEDYGFNIVSASSKLEAQAKILETREDYMNEIARNSDMRAHGAAEDSDAVIESEERMNILRENLAEYRTMWDQFNDVPVSEQDYNGWIQTIIQVQDMIRKAMADGDEDGVAYYESWLEGFAKDHGVALSDDLMNVMSPAYDEWIDGYKEKLEKMSDYLPNLMNTNTKDLENGYVTSFKNAFDELKSLVEESGSEIDWNFDVPSAKLQDLAHRLGELKSIQIDAEINPGAQAALDALIQSTENEINLRYVLNNANSGTGISLEELASLTDDEKKKVIMEAVALTDNQTQSLIEYINGKKAELPIKVQFDQSTIDAFAKLLGVETVKIDEFDVTNNAVDDLNNQIQQAVKPFETSIDLGFSRGFLEEHNIDTDVTNLAKTLMTDSGNSDKINEQIDKYIDDSLALGETSTFLLQTHIDDQTFKEALDAWNGVIDPAKFEPYREQFQQMADEAGVDIETVVQALSNANEILKQSVDGASEQLDKVSLTMLNTYHRTTEAIQELTSLTSQDGKVQISVGDMRGILNNTNSSYEEIQEMIDSTTFKNAREAYANGEALDAEDQEILQQKADNLGVEVWQVIEAYNNAAELLQNQFNHYTADNFENTKKELIDLRNNVNNASAEMSQEIIQVGDSTDELKTKTQFMQEAFDLLKDKADGTWEKFKEDTDSINQSIGETSIEPVQAKFEELGDAVDKTSEKVDNLKEKLNTVTGGGSGNDTISATSEPESSSLVVMKVTFNQEQTQESIQEVLTQVQTYADEHDVKVEINGEDLTTEKVEEITSKVEEGNTITLTIAGQEDEQNKASAMISKLFEYNGQQVSIFVKADPDGEVFQLDQTLVSMTEEGKYTISIPVRRDKEDTDLEEYLNELVNWAQEHGDINIAVNGTDITTANTDIATLKETIGNSEEFVVDITAPQDKLQEAVDKINEIIQMAGQGGSLNIDTNPARGEIDALRTDIQDNPANLSVNTDAMKVRNDIQETLNANPVTVTVQGNYVQPVIPGAMPAITGAHGTLSAYAQGTGNDVAVSKDQDALVNEVNYKGQQSEGLIRNGVLTELSPGMHVEHLQKGDVILNARQMFDLKKKGKANGSAKLVGGDSALALGTVRKDFFDEEFPALALGTIYNDMPSYASGGYIGGRGGLNEAGWTSMQIRAGMIDETVDNLDDLNDGLGDAADNLGDSADNLGDALDSATEQVEHSSQVIDLIERRLKYFADRTKKIADQMQEYMSTFTKRGLLSDQISAVLDEIYANSRATTAYREEADKTARDFKYYGQDEGYVQYIQEQTDAWKAQMAGLDRNSEEYKSMQPQLDALNNQLNELKNQKNEYHIDLASEIDLDALRRGDYRFEEIDTSTQHGQALYDAAQEYMSKYDKSISADQNIDALSDQLRDLFSQMIQLPFDELSKSLNKLEKTLQTLTGLADASAKGESTVRQLNKILEETFGPEKAKKYFNSVGKPFQAANREIDKALKKQKQQVEANNQAYESSVNTKKDLQRRLKDAKRRKQNAGGSYYANDLFTSGTDLTANFSTGSDIDGLFTARSGSSSGSADSIADAKKAEVEIRELEDAIKEADEKMKEQLEATKQSAIEYAQALIQSVFDKLDNINNYYKSLSDWQALLGEQLSQNRDYLIKTGSYIKDSKDIIKSYSDEIGIYNQEANILAENISEQKKQLDEAVQNGTIEIDSMEYRQAATEIKNLEIEYTRLRSTQQDLFKEMVNVPAEKYAEAINKIENAYSDLNTVMSKNLAATRSSQIALSRAGQALSNLGISNGFGKYNQSNLSFANQNVQLSEDTKQQQENLQEAARYYRQTQLNYEAIKNTPNIDPGQVKSALEAMEEARKVMDDALANAVNAEIENAYQSVKAVDEYYSSFYNHYKNMSDAIESYREAQEAFGRRMDENGDLITDTTAINESYRKQIEYLSKAQENVNQDIVDTKVAMDNVANTLGTDSERYRELEDHLIGLQNESVGLTVKAEQLGDAWREKLIKPFDESIEKFQTIRNNFAAMNGLISDEMKLTKDGEWTQLGQVSLTLDMGAYTNSLKELEKAEARFNEIEEMHRKNEYESDEEYLKERQESIEKIQSAMSSSFSARQTLLDDMKKRYQQEVNFIKELINAQSKELSKRKEIADYEKNMHKKNLAIQDIESQIRAISGLEDAESKAQRARLEAQKKELTDERDETVQNHIYDLRQEGLQQLSEDLDKSFEKYSENLALNIGEATEAIGGLSDALTGKLTETNTSLLEYLRTFNTGLTTEMATGQSQLNADNATQILNQKLLQDSANSMISYQNNLSSQMNDKIFGENGYPAQQIAEQKAMDALVQKYQGEQKEREDALKAQNEQGGTAFDQRNIIATSIKGDEKSIINVLEGKFGDLESKLGKEGPLYQAVSTQKAIEETKDMPKNANVDTTPIGSNAPTQNSQSETNTSQITTGGTSHHTFDPNNLTANKNITQKKEVDKNRDYAATIIHKAFNDYKKYGFSSAKKMLDHLYKRKTIDKSKLTDAGAKGNVTYWNSNGVKASQETIKELINSEIDKNGSSIKKYASGTLSARSGLSQVFEQGPEIITTPKGTFIPFAGGEGVIPAKETANLMKLAHAMESGKLQLQMPDMSSYKIPEVKQNVTNNSEIHIDSLITINGNADQNTVDQIRQIAQQLISDKRFQENVTQFVSQRQARDARMSGMRSGIK